MLDEELAAALDTALHGDQGSLTLAAGWPMASPVFNQGRNNPANPGETSASAPGPSRPESRSYHAGIAVKCAGIRKGEHHMGKKADLKRDISELKKDVRNLQRSNEILWERISEVKANVDYLSDTKNKLEKKIDKLKRRCS